MDFNALLFLWSWVVLALVGTAAAEADPTCAQIIHEFDWTDPARHEWLETHKALVASCAESLTCADFTREVTKRQMKEVDKCTAELGYTTGAERKAKMYCTFKCVMRNAKLLTADGKIDDHFVQDMFERYTPMTPPRFQPLVKKSEEMFKKCREEHESKFDDTEETCQSYGPLIQCMMGMMTICKELKE